MDGTRRLVEEVWWGQWRVQEAVEQIAWHSEVPTRQALVCCPNIGAVSSRRTNHRNNRHLVAKDMVLVLDMECAYEVRVAAFELAAPGGDLLPTGQGHRQQGTVSRRLSHCTVCESTADPSGGVGLPEGPSPGNVAASGGMQQAVDAGRRL